LEWNRGEGNVEFFCKEFSHFQNPVQNVLATRMILAADRWNPTVAKSSHVWVLKRIERFFFGSQDIQAAIALHRRGVCSGGDRDSRNHVGTVSTCPAASLFQPSATTAAAQFSTSFYSAILSE
jgi:hypothetical protein